MATNSGGWLYAANGTPVDKATADNAQARVLEVKADIHAVAGPLTARTKALEAAAGFTPGDPTDAAMSGIGSNPESMFHDVLDEAISSSLRLGGSSRWSLEEVVQDVAVSSDTIRQFIRTSDPAVVASSGDDTVVFYEGRPGVETDFMFSVTDESIPIWDHQDAWVKGSGTSLQRNEAGSANAFVAAVPRVATGFYGDVDIVTLTQYAPSTQPGFKSGLFARGRGSSPTPGLIYAGIQTRDTDGSSIGGLRLNAASGGAIGQVAESAGQTAANAAWRNLANTWYYIRLRVINGTVMAKQWFASDPEPSAWDLLIPESIMPTDFRSGGSNARGMVGLYARHNTVQLFEYMAIAFDGASAPVRAA